MSVKTATRGPLHLASIRSRMENFPSPHGRVTLIPPEETPLSHGIRSTTWMLRMIKEILPTGTMTRVMDNSTMWATSWASTPAIPRQPGNPQSGLCKHWWRNILIYSTMPFNRILNYVGKMQSCWRPTGILQRGYSTTSNQIENLQYDWSRMVLRQSDSAW